MLDCGDRTLPNGMAMLIFALMERRQRPARYSGPDAQQMRRPDRTATWTASGYFAFVGGAWPPARTGLFC